MTSSGRCKECDAITGRYDQHKKAWICDDHVVGASRAVTDFKTIKNEFYKKEKKPVNNKFKSPYGKRYF